MFHLQLLIFSFIIFNKLIYSAEPVKNQTKSDKGGRVYGGSLCSTKQHGYMIQLLGVYYERNYPYTDSICGATLIKPKWGLTAAHCKDRKAERFEILAAASTKPRKRKVKNFYVHPKYNTRFSELPNDIAILELFTSLSETQDGVRFAKLPNPSQPDKDPMCKIGMVMGWGEMENKLYPKDNQLQCGYIPLLTLKKCQRIVTKEVGMNINSNQICALSAYQVDTLAGDSGGPLFCGDIQVGVVSWGPTYEEIFSFPGVYTKVRSYLDFINGFIEEETESRLNVVPLNDTNIIGSNHGENIHRYFVLNNFITIVLLFLI